MTAKIRNISMKRLRVKKVLEPGDIVEVDTDSLFRAGIDETMTALAFDREYTVVSTAPYKAQLDGMGWFPSWMLDIAKGENQ